MITHFQWKPLFRDLPGWNISFYFSKQYYQAIYHKDGQIEWISSKPAKISEPNIIKSIHELMLFHVYE